ncbi:O-acetylhomoserine aminocarboxypropyltransferase/cysteine synthase [Microbacterium protaetiae]|uniref:homocysteine desulfhydrase n=1 Tax=Microbacterium protaetiae TaxID=2509458 RepID=A0A4P6E8Z2_9MICO|nr:PLP-dependent transferase [Microbacterium protaetiae]QAY58612.1 O-acetylhomoserine aminocarboxypropyltransferase/cysteine synthase [Microbacterium protaetiae]
MSENADCPPPSFATAQVQAGYAAPAAPTSAVPPIYQSNAFALKSLTHARDLFAHRADGDVYARTGNPTATIFEQRITALEDGVAAAGIASGQAAVALTILALTGRGGHVVAANQLYGGTVDLLVETLPDWGIETTFVDQDDIDAWHAAVRPSTRLFFAETVANPIAQVLDVRAVADAAHAAGVPLVVDNTVATPYLQRPKRFGADISVHSATKFIGGHGTVIGGAIVDLGTFDFSAEPEKWPALTEPSRRIPSGESLLEHYRDTSPFIALIKAKHMHDLGPTLSATTAFALLQGLETLDIRMQRHAASAQRIAEHLATHPAVARVHHPGLAGNPWHDAAQTYLERGVPSVFSIDLHSTGDDEADFVRAETFIAGLKVLHLLANIGDARSIVTHPASMTHSHLSPQQLADGGISWATVRLSIGLEDADDLIADLDRALALL